MTINIYVDGSGHPKSGFGWFIKETGKSHYTRPDNLHLTNNQAEYFAIISAIKYVKSDLINSNNDNTSIVIYSDSLNTVKQLNHEYAINNAALRELAREAWSVMSQITEFTLDIKWIRRKDNLAGKMLGS